jgi:hypothetical protein
MSFSMYCLRVHLMTEERAMVDSLSELNEKIKTLKQTKDILTAEYSKTEFHKKKEAHSHSTIPASPDDEEIYKLLTAIRQIETYIKKFQDQQFEMIKQSK